MSTHDSYLLAWSGIIVQDLIAPLIGRELTDRARIRLIRIGVMLIGLLLLVFGVWYELKDAAFRYLVQTTTIYYAGALAVLVGGLYWKRTTAAGAYLGFTLGAALPLTYIFADLLTQFGIGWAGTLVELFPSIG